MIIDFRFFRYIPLNNKCCILYLTKRLRKESTDFTPRLFSLYSSRLHLYKWQFLWVPHKDGVRDFFLVVVVEWCVGKKDLVLNLEIELILDVRELALRTT